jgi:hypothetical protein
LEYQDEVCNGEKVKTEPDDPSLKMRTKNHWRIKTSVEDLMLVMLKRLKLTLKSLKFRFGFNFYSSINSLTLVLILQYFHVLLKLFLFKVVRLSLNFVNILFCMVTYKTNFRYH